MAHKHMERCCTSRVIRKDKVKPRDTSARLLEEPKPAAPRRCGTCQAAPPGPPDPRSLPRLCPLHTHKENPGLVVESSGRGAEDLGLPASSAPQATYEAQKGQGQGHTRVDTYPPPRDTSRQLYDTLASSQACAKPSGL